jgi:hypothetical protein
VTTAASLRDLVALATPSWDIYSRLSVALWSWGPVSRARQHLSNHGKPCTF